MMVERVRAAMATNEDFQPYFVAYAMAEGTTPKVMAGRSRIYLFMVWIQAQWRAWEGLAPEHAKFCGEQRRRAFEGWLPERVVSLLKGRERTAGQATQPPGQPA
jgi:hypothetical protein